MIKIKIFQMHYSHGVDVYHQRNAGYSFHSFSPASFSYRYYLYFSFLFLLLIFFFYQKFFLIKFFFFFSGFSQQQITNSFANKKTSFNLFQNLNLFASLDNFLYLRGLLFRGILARVLFLIRIDVYLTFNLHLVHFSSFSLLFGFGF